MLRCQGTLYDGWMPISPAVAKCPECGGTLLMQVNTWETETGIPDETGIEIECEHETWPEDGSSEPNHRWWQGEWMETVDKVRAWARRWVRVERS